MNEVYDCNHIPECEIGDDGCVERIWSWKHYCSGRNTGPVLTEDEIIEEETVEAIIVEPQQVHIPVDTAGDPIGFLAAFICLGGILSVMIGIILAIIRK